MAGPRTSLPQLTAGLLLADGGIETDLIHGQDLELPHFAAFVLLDDERGREALRTYYRPYLRIARDAGLGLVLESPTWRASRDWGDLLGYDTAGLERVNRQGVGLLRDLRDQAGKGGPAVVISGCLGPRADGVAAATAMTADEAQRYHAPQVQALAAAASDLVSALTLGCPAEAVGITRAAQAVGVPVVISFTVGTTGRLPDGSTLADAVLQVDAATGGGPVYYMVNCAHPRHLARTFDHDAGAGATWTTRVKGLRANASTRSHAELDAATDLDDGDPARFGAECAGLRARLPALTVLGGCCGTDARHIEAIARACLPATDPLSTT